VVDAAPQPPAPPDGIRPELPAGAVPADLDAVQASYETALTGLLSRWPSLSGPQVTAILDQIESHVGAGDVVGLLSIAVSSTEAAAVLERAMLDLGNEAGAQVVAEAVKQGLSENDLHATPPERLRTAQSAQVFAGQLATFLVGSAIGETMRVWLRGRSSRDVRNDVAAHLDKLTDAYPRLVLGGALTQAQHDGRWQTMLGGPEAALYADEVLDTDTCLAPETLVTTTQGSVAACEVTMDDPLLTHTGRWIRPSRITVFTTRKIMVTVRAGSHCTRITEDHQVLVWNDIDGFTWCQAGELSPGDFVVSEPLFEGGRETWGFDLGLGQTPDGEASVFEVGGLSSVNVGAQAVPVRAISLDDQVSDHEVNNPRADPGLNSKVETGGFEDEANCSLNAGFGVARHVATDGAEPALGRSRGRLSAEGHSALFANQDYRGAAARFGAMGARLGSTMPERGAAPTADSATTARLGATCSGAVSVPVGVGCRNGEGLLAVRADLIDPVARRPHLRSYGRIGVLALDRAVRDLRLVAAGKFAPTRYAPARDVADRAPNAPPLDRCTPLAANTSLAPGNRASAVNTRSVHSFILLQVTRVDQALYDGTVYDFTIPGDHSFVAGGIVVHNCGPCRAINRKWIGNASDASPSLVYPVAGYVGCLGRWRCRGQVVAVWRGGNNWKEWVEMPDQRGTPEEIEKWKSPDKPGTPWPLKRPQYQENT
jgi:hypothetical protein